MMMMMMMIEETEETNENEEENEEEEEEKRERLGNCCGPHKTYKNKESTRLLKVKCVLGV